MEAFGAKLRYPMQLRIGVKILSKVHLHGFPVTRQREINIYIYVYIHLIMIVIIKFSQFLHVVPLKVMILCCQTGFTRAYVNVLLTKWAWLQSGRYIVLVFRLNRSTSTSTLVCKKAAGPWGPASLAVVTRQGMGQATDHVRKARRSQTNYFGY
jgi:hypothetical protein